MEIIIFTAGLLIGTLLTVAIFKFMLERDIDDIYGYYHPDLDEREKRLEDLQRAVDKYGLNK